MGARIQATQPVATQSTNPEDAQPVQLTRASQKDNATGKPNMHLVTPDVSEQEQEGPSAKEKFAEQKEISKAQNQQKQAELKKRHAEVEARAAQKKAESYGTATTALSTGATVCAGVAAVASFCGPVGLVVAAVAAIVGVIFGACASGTQAAAAAAQKDYQKAAQEGAQATAQAADATKKIEDLKKNQAQSAEGGKTGTEAVTDGLPPENKSAVADAQKAQDAGTQGEGAGANTPGDAKVTPEATASMEAAAGQPNTNLASTKTSGTPPAPAVQSAAQPVAPVPVSP